jgi:hypothetical protein
MSTTKVDLKRELRACYAPGTTPELVEVPELRFVMIDGHGDPESSPSYARAIQAVYGISYAAHFELKRHGLDYVVMPLESLWWAPDLAVFTSSDRSAWQWTAMILQPPEVTEEVFEVAREIASRKADDPEATARTRLERFAEGLSAQVLHVGAYADEGPTIRRLHAYIEGQGYRPAGKHHEIYLSDPRRTAPARLRTVIRQPVG